MYPFSKYKFYTTPDNTTIAVSTYAGKTVKGIAKMDPRDKFDAEYGKQLAAARCAMKVAKKRKNRADRQVSKAYAEMNKAYRLVEKMKAYQNDAMNELEGAVVRVTELEARG
jgi:hypothetical protein